jgi:diguanylate cyclase (GGDEF)-like protein/PAS domain S-box-containing protein
MPSATTPVALIPPPPQPDRALTPTPTPQLGAASLQTLLEQVAGAGCWTYDVMPPRLSWSDALATLLQWPPAVSPGWVQALDFFAPESRSAMADALHACMSRAQPFDQEVMALTAKGQRLKVRAVGRAECDDNGQLLRVQGLLQNRSLLTLDEKNARGTAMQLSSTLASLREAFATVDSEGRFTYVNAETQQLLKRSSSELLERRIWRELDDQGTERLRRELQGALSCGRSTEFEAFYAPINRWLELRAYPFDGGLAIYLKDVNERRRAQEQLLLLQTSIARLNDIVMITEAGRGSAPRIVFVNDAFERLTGYSQAEVINRTPELLEGPLTQATELDRIRKARRRWQPIRTELINYKKNGDIFWLEVEIVPVDESPRGVKHWVTVGRDITARKAADDEIEHLAFYDTLTELPNRQLLMERLQRALKKSDRPPRHGALMFIDLDHFKLLNDTLGHARGDLLLQQVAARLMACVRSGDTVARLGGDEFVVMLQDLASKPALALAKSRLVGEKILHALSEPYDLAGHPHHGTCSIGITPFHPGHESIGELLKQADLAMYQAKAAGRNALCFFDPTMQATATANAALTSELRRGLHEQQFVLHYQPQVGRNNQMTGVEALIRWHSDKGLALPGEFIAQAEESGLILPLGQWVLETACAQLAQWALRPETAHLSVAVNVSVRQFRHPEFVEMVMKVMQDCHIRPDRLKLELTESLLATDIEVTIAKMGVLKDVGVTLSLDDFGVGYSALSYLKHLPLDQLKIDRNFVKDVLTDPNDAAIARTIISLAQSLGLAVMAEGVETEAQREFLSRHGCDFYQGYLYCKPLPINELEAFMRVAQ